jgi:hypothetical protein
MKILAETDWHMAVLVEDGEEIEGIDAGVTLIVSKGNYSSLDSLRKLTSKSKFMRTGLLVIKPPFNDHNERLFSITMLLIKLLDQVERD